MADNMHISYATHAEYSYCIICRANSKNSQTRENLELQVAFHAFLRERKQTVSAYCIHSRQMWFIDSVTKTVKQVAIVWV